MNSRHLSAIATLFFLIASFISGAAAQPGKYGKASDYNRRGLRYFNEAFYGHLPNGKEAEAGKYFDLAAAEFNKALAVNPRFAEAYRNLARLHYVRKDFARAAEDYRMVTLLEPRNIDAYLQLALSCTRIDRPNEAIRQLEIAKGKTHDSEVIGKLDGYIRKIRERQQ